MAHVLVVDDSPEQAMIVCALLEECGHATQIAVGGQAALEMIAAKLPDVVVTDLVMPGIGGLELVESTAALHPTLPIILMTAFGNGEIAMAALRQGAASYVPKQLLNEQLVDTIENVLEMTQARHERTRLLRSVERCELRFVLDNDPSLIAPLVSYVRDSVVAYVGGSDETELMQIGLAVHEALSNAIHHGNLDVSSELRERSFEEYTETIERRRKDPAYSDRRVQLKVVFRGGDLVLIVRDDGQGFDVSTVPDPEDPENLLLVHGRGLYLIGTFMDQVAFNAIGNEITMLKHLGRREEA